MCAPEGPRALSFPKHREAEGALGDKALPRAPMSAGAEATSRSGRAGPQAAALRLATGSAPRRSAARPSLRDETTRPWKEDNENVLTFEEKGAEEDLLLRLLERQTDRQRMAGREVGAMWAPALLCPSSHGAGALALMASDHPVAAPWSALNRACPVGARPPPGLLSHWLAGHPGHCAGRPSHSAARPGSQGGGTASCAECPPGRAAWGSPRCLAHQTGSCAAWALF